MKRHPGNILARPSFEEVFRYYTEKYVYRYEGLLPHFLRKRLRKWVSTPKGRLHRMLTALLLGLQLAHSLIARMSNNRWRVPVLPLYMLSGAFVAMFFITTWAQWPTPVTPIDIDELFHFRGASTGTISWAEDESSPIAEGEIPPELYPLVDATYIQPVIASVDLPLNYRFDSTSPADSLALASRNNSKIFEKQLPNPQPPPVAGIQHSVRRGETLWDISQAYGVECDTVRMYNPHVDPRRMQQGQKIFIPGVEKSILIARKTKMSLPIANAWVISGFGMRKHPLGGHYRYHNGIDLPADTGAPVRAVMDGVVVYAGWRQMFGKVVVLKHNGGLETVYAHNSEILVKVGDRVDEGRVISRVGTTGRSTGPHCHFEVIKNGKHVDPEQYLPKMPHTRPTSVYARR